jgi:UDP-glucose:(heptosyl)LPS alpha-1,3-glucosyltransferase
MRIGIAYLEYGRSKGIERISAEIADRIAKRGHDVHFHCTRWEHATDSLVQFHKVRTIDVLNSSKLFSFAVLGKRSLNRGHYDITHSYGNLIGCDVITAQSCHRAGVEIARSLRSKTIKSGVNFGIADRIRLYLERENFGKRLYRAVIACSNLVKRELMKYYNVPESDIVVISNGVDTEQFHPRNRDLFLEQVRARYGIGCEQTVLLFVGHEFGRKGLAAALRSLPVLKNKSVKLLVCGGDHADPFRQLARSLGVDRQVFFLGAQPDVKKFYAASDVFVLPTLHEAFGLVITEAMASGLPVIVSKTAGAAEDLIEDGRDGLLLDDPLSAEEIGAKLRLLIDDTSLRRSIGLQAREKVKTYTWDSCAQRVLDVYERVRHQKFA